MTAKPLHILLAEDSKVNQILSVALLEEAEHTVTVVGTGTEAIEACSKEDFDLVLMDIHMPEMDGTDATMAIREREKSTGKHVLILAMTAADRQGDRETFREAGMDGYLAKPIEIDDLNKALSELSAQ